MKSELKGFNKIFSFTFLQHIKGKAYKTTTLAIALALFLIPVAIFVGIEVFGGSDETGEIDAVPVDMTTIERLYIVDDTDDGRADMSALPMILQQAGVNAQFKYYDDNFEDARKAAGKDDNALILYTQKDGELYTTTVIIPDKSKISEDAAYTFQIYLDQYLYALDMAHNGYIPDEEPVTDDEEVYVDEEDVEEEENLSLAFMIVSYLNVMILYFFVLAYGQSVANSVVMEKSSKLMETFLISVKPMAMIMGKLTAITFAGIIQFVSWVASLILGILAGVGLVNIINPDAELTVVSIFEMIRELAAGMFSPVNCLLALMMIVVGLLLYCSLAGIGGALAGKSEDLASTNVIFTMVLVISFLVCIYTGTLNGDMDAAPWLDWIPFTAVMITPAKALLGTVSVWRSLASFGIIAVTTLAVTFIAGKLYKMMVLYKGEPLKPAAILKMLKTNKEVYMNQVIENILTRRSVRKFTEEKISRQDLELILKCAAYAPSGMNKQTWQFTAITDRNKLYEFAAVIGNELGREGYNFYNADVLIIPSNVRDGIWSKEDNACALENIFLAAHSLGIGSVWINQLQTICDKPVVRAFLREWGIPEEHVVHGMAALGYAETEPSQNVEKKGIIKIID